MKRPLAGIAVASLVLAVLMLLQRVGALHDQIARMQRERARPGFADRSATLLAAEASAGTPVERTVVVEKAVVVPVDVPAVAESNPAPAPSATQVAEDEAARSGEVATLTRLVTSWHVGYAESLDDLSDYQRVRLEEHKRQRDIAHAAADELYDAAARMELSAEQYEKFKSRGRIGYLITGDALYRGGAPIELNP